MKFILLSLFITINLFAHEKWISLEKSKLIKRENQTDINLSQFKSVDRLLQGAKIIFPLLDKKNSTKKQNLNIDKKWFRLNKL